MKRRSFRSMLFLGLWGWTIAVLMVSRATGQETRAIQADDQWRLAEMYLNRGDTDRAVSELERFCFFFPEEVRSPAAGLKIGEIYLAANRYEDAVKAFGRVIETHGTKEAALQANFLTAEAYRKWGRAGQAFLSLNNILSLYPDPWVRDEARFRMGWLAVEAGEIEESARIFSGISVAGWERHRIADLETALADKASIPEKSPAFSGFLSIIPGLGYLYCGRPKDAAMSFIINGALMGATWEAFREDLPILGGFLALVEIGFYGGNIYGGISSAHKYNRTGYRRFADDVKNRLNISFGPMPSTGGIGLGVQGSF